MEAIERLDEAYPGNGEFPLMRKVPIPMDAELLFLEQLRRSTPIPPDDVLEISKGLRGCSGYILVIFALRMAVLAVRSADRDKLIDALPAMALAYDILHQGDQIYALLIFEYCANQLGINLRAAVDEVRYVAPAHRRDTIYYDYFSIPEESRTLARYDYDVIGEGQSLSFKSKSEYSDIWD